MIGQGSPSRWNERKCALARALLRSLTLLLALIVFVSSVDSLIANELDVRLRLAWGNGDGRHRWIGRISCPGAKLEDLQTLGIETDAPAAILLEGDELVINPWEKRGFDGCDITVVGASDSLMRFELRSDQTGVPKVVEVPLSQLARGQVREPIDTLGSFLLAYRSPGDRFRVLSKRENLIFSPGELWSLRLKTDFAVELEQGPIAVDVAMRAIGRDEVLWQYTQAITSASTLPDAVAFEVPCPLAEGGYRLSINGRTEEGLATRLVPGQTVRPFATREIDLVVIDPSNKLPRLADSWIPVLSIDPANPSWWQRLPTWAQVSRLTGKPPGSLGNVRLLPHTGRTKGLVELAPSPDNQNPSWQSFALPVQDTGVPHLVQITYPLAIRQNLGVSLIEPDASGRVLAPIVESDLVTDDVLNADITQLGTHRILFWPRTQSPQLVIVNHSTLDPGVFGLVTLSRHNDAASLELAAPSLTRPVSSYIAKPVFAQTLGATEVLDPASGLSVQSWSTFLDGARRLTQYLKLRGHNSALITVAADGSALYPSKHLMPSPRYDTGQIAANGQDPQRKDVLEMLLRICDREAVSIMPTIQLSTPLPELEMLCRAGASGVSWVDSQGRQLIDVKQSSARLAANYNLLNELVQKEVSAVVLEIAKRYGKHPMMSGIALQLDSNGFGVTPGLEWGLDDQTLGRFSNETGIALPSLQERQTQQIVDLFLEQNRDAWQAWRIRKVTEFYGQLAEQIRAHRQDLKLVLITDNLFAELELQQAVRAAGSNPGKVRQLLAERGIDLVQLASLPGVEVTNICLPTPDERLQEHVTDVVISDLAQRGELLAPEKQSLHLLYQNSATTRVPSFDERSPFGIDHTRLTLSRRVTSSASARHLLAAMRNKTTTQIVEGGEFLSMSLDPDHTRRLRAWSQIPLDASEVRTLTEQPVTVSIYRSGDATFLTCANNSPWQVTGELEIESAQNANWVELGTNHNLEPNAPLVGKVSLGKTSLALQIKPYDLRVWKFDTTKIKTGKLNVSVSPKAHDYLTEKIERLESRTGNLNIERDYPQLQNPSFELEEGTTRIFGWQPRKGINGSVELETSAAHTGTRSLAMKSEDDLGVAVQSHLFAVPVTGMMVVAARVQVRQAEKSARMILALETEDPLYRRVQAVPLNSDLVNQWSLVEFVVNDLPVGDADQLRVFFHLVGQADVLVDDIQLFDLRFDDQRRTELVKQVFAAKTALEEHQYVDCLRLLNEYWPRYLVEYVPPAERTSPTLAKQPDSASSNEKEESKSRLRSWMPRLFR